MFALPVGLLWGAVRFRMPPGDADTEQHLVLHGPLRLVTVQAVLWGVAATLFIVLNAGWSLRLAASVGETIPLGGITTCALSYLLSERILRPTAARVLAAHPPRQQVRPGVVVRALLFWALGTAVPVVGLLLSAVSALAYGDVSPGRLAVIVLAVGGTALVAGLLVTAPCARTGPWPTR